MRASGRMALGAAVLALACSDPRSTKIPADLTDFPKIQGSLDKLDSADRRRVAAYEMRARLGGIFGGSAPAAGGITIGEAIKNQMAFEAAAARQAAADSIASAAVAKERAEKMRLLMEEALATSLTKLEVKGAASDSYGQFIYMHVTFQNRGTKPIAGVKGVARGDNHIGLRSSAICSETRLRRGELASTKGSRSTGPNYCASSLERRESIRTTGASPRLRSRN